MGQVADAADDCAAAGDDDDGVGAREEGRL